MFTNIVNILNLAAVRLYVKVIRVYGLPFTYYDNILYLSHFYS